MMDKVKNYNSEVPMGKFGVAGLRWASLFVADFFLELSQRKDANGKIIKKLKNPTLVGSRFRALHDRAVSRLKQENPNTFDKPFVIPSIEATDFDKEFFDYWRKDINMPIVVKGFLKGTEIMEYAKKEFLIKHRGDTEVKCMSKDNKDDNRLGQNLEPDITTLENFLTSPDFQNHYINNFYGILEDEDFDTKCNGLELDQIQGQRNIIAQWFISRSSKLGSSLHCAGGENMFLNIVGQKEWHFIDPSYTAVLQASVSKYGVYAISEMMEEIGTDGHAELIAGYPHMRHVPFYKTVLEEGDLLFNPPFWWHTVRNLSDYNVGCATRYWSSTPNSVPITTCMLLDILKHPKKNGTIQILKMMKGRHSKKELMDVIFSKKSGERKQKEVAA